MPNKYQVADWTEHFETAKTARYVHKSSVVLPLKQGLGYRRLVRRNSGPALYGAWCAMIVVLSKQAPPREGYLTHSGTKDGIPYAPQDLEMLTDIPVSVFAEMLVACSRPEIGWLKVIERDEANGDMFREPETTLAFPNPSPDHARKENGLRCPHDEMKAEWNRLCLDSDLAKCRVWPTDRAAKMWKHEWFRESWKEIFAECHRAKWCRENKAGVLHVLRNDKSGTPNAMRYYEAAMDRKEAIAGKPRAWTSKIVEADGAIRIESHATEALAAADLEGRGYSLVRARNEWRKRG